MEYYDILGVTNKATSDEIKKAYRKLAMQHHPDKGGDVSMFTKIQEAYDTLSDPVKRKDYDNPIRFNTSQFKAHSTWADEFFSEYFRQERANRKQIFRTVVHINLVDAYNGGSVQLNVSTPNGNRPVSIKFPKGISDGSQIRYDNVIDGNTTLIATFFIKPLSNVTRVDDHLYCETRLSVLDLIVGTTIDFETISGKKINVSIPPKTQPGQKVRIAGHGMPIGETGLYGDQFLLINAFIPDNVSQDVINAILQSKQP